MPSNNIVSRCLLHPQVKLENCRQEDADEREGYCQQDAGGTAEKVSKPGIH